MTLCRPSASESVLKRLLSCAALNGIDPNIISRANELSLLAARGEDLLAVCTELSPEETGELTEAVSQFCCTSWLWRLTLRQEAIARAFVAKDFSTPKSESTKRIPSNEARISLEEALSTVAGSLERSDEPNAES